MSKRNLNIIELILQGLAILLLFLPGMYSWEHWNEEAVGVYRRTLSMDITFFHAAGNTYDLFSFLIFGLMLSNIFILLLSIFKSSKTNKVHIVVPILTIVFLALFSFIAGIRGEYGYCAPINWLFYIEMFFLISIVFVAFMKNSKYIEEQSKKVVSDTAISSADELKKYKELFDSGIITQEEFESKKKQLLGL